MGKLAAASLFHKVDQCGVPIRLNTLRLLDLWVCVFGNCEIIAPACADRSCGPPKPGAAYENQPDGAAGGPPSGRRGPTGPRRARGDAVACPGGPNINRAPIRDSRATRRMTTCSELRLKAHIFFWAKTDMPPQMTYLLVLL